jgi:hypothetical protein
MFNKPTPEPEVSAQTSIRQLLIFQFKLAMDAVRDFALSPLSILFFIIDSIRKPSIEDSLYQRLMKVGRHSDRVINLFDEHGGGEHYTVDKTLAEVEEVVNREVKKER